uniref:Ig-like domain-containing protein n=1 Tax=Salarias fasciatus TaxID=181472 RepID=A0A672FZB6_SALFA
MVCSLTFILSLKIFLKLENSVSVSDSLVVVVGSPPAVPRGGSTTLPCWITPPQSAEPLEVRWHRGDFDSPILHYQENKFVDTSKEASYVGRVSFGSKDAASGGLKTGDVSLKLTNVTVGDAGSYLCYVSSDRGFDSATVSLSVIGEDANPCDFSGDFPDGQKVTCVTAVKGTPGFSSGQHYWEVSLKHPNLPDPKRSWWLGVTSASEIPHEADFSPNTSNGFWFLSSSRDVENKLQISTEPQFSLPVHDRPCTVGVYLNRDSGELSFYNVEKKCLIGSLTAAFTGEVFPLFNPGKGDPSVMEILHRTEQTQGDSDTGNHAQVSVGVLLSRLHKTIRTFLIVFQWSVLLKLFKTQKYQMNTALCYLYIIKPL